MGNTTEEVVKTLPPGVRRLVLLVHDESTCTANDGPKASWVMEGEQLRKVLVGGLIAVM